MRTGLFGKAWLLGGYAFLYLPIAALVIFSFNDSALPNIWRGFTLKWYAALLDDREILAGFWVSLKIAFFTACGSVVLGTLAAFALVKYRRFKGRTLFSGMVNAPLVMPEVVVGLSLLLMLVSVQNAIGFPEKGALTIWIGHLLLGMAYATVVIQARLQDLNPQLEEAAMDLGARPHQVFWLVTLPMIAQSAGLGLAADVHDLARRRRALGLSHRPRRDDDAARDLLARQARPEPERQCSGDDHRRARRHRRRRRQLPHRPQRAPPPAGAGRGLPQLNSTHDKRKSR